MIKKLGSDTPKQAAIQSMFTNLSTKDINMNVFEKDAGISKTANTGETGMVPNQFYSPRLTPDTWYLPRTRKMLLKWVKIFFDHDPYINSILNMHARYPISDFNLSMQHEKHKQFFEESLNNSSFNTLDVMREGSISLKKYGEAVCLAGDTSIRLLDGTSKTIKELYDNKTENFWVYSLDKNNNIVPGKADKIILTKENAEVIKITLDNNESFKCTPNHLIMMRDGSYKEAKDLLINESVMPLNTHDQKIHYKFTVSKNNYELTYNPKKGCSIHTHKLIAEAIYGEGSTKGKIVHHRNFDPKDNRPENLQIMTFKEHRQFHNNLFTPEHRKFLSDRNIRLYSDPAYRIKKGKLIAAGQAAMTKKQKLSLSKKLHDSWTPERKANMAIKISAALKGKSRNYSEEHKETLGKNLYNRIWKDKTPEERSQFMLDSHKHLNGTKRDPSVGAKISKANLIIYNTPEAKLMLSTRMKNYWGKRRNILSFIKILKNILNIKIQNTDNYIYENHKILSIEKSQNENVYDIQCVDKYHNFALSCGVFVHNCIGNWNYKEGIWDSFTWMDPAMIIVEEIPFTNKVSIFAEIPAKYIKLCKSTKPVDMEKAKSIPNVLKDAINAGKKYIELDTEEGINPDGSYKPATCCMLINKSDVGEDGLRGLPPITPLLKDLVYSDYLRKAQMARAQRFAYPIEIWKVGDVANDYIPSERDLSNIRQMLQQALASPPYTIVWTPLISLEIVGAAGSLLPIYDDYNFIENRLLIGLGTNKNIILGEGGWMGNAKTLSMQRLIMDYSTERDMWANKFLRNFVLRPMCKAHRILKPSPLSKDTMIPDIPKIIWTRSLDIQQEEDNKRLYHDLWKDGLVSSKTLLAKFPDLDFTTEIRNLEAERGTILDNDTRKLPEFIKSLNNTNDSNTSTNTNIEQKIQNGPTAPSKPLNI